MRELFVWYRVAGSKAAAARAAVLQMQRALTAGHPGLVTRLLARDDDGSEGALTWMETYACGGSPTGVDAALERSIEDRARSLDGLIEGARHPEVFEPVRG